MNQLANLRDYLTVIHDEFAILYDAVENSTFAMDIEYKINSEGQLIIKQARPWVSYIYDEATDGAKECTLTIFPNPTNEYVNVTCRDCDLTSVRITDLTGKLVEEKQLAENGSANSHIYVGQLSSGVYLVSGFIGKKHCVSERLLIHKE